MYLHIINQNTPFSRKLIWKLKIPLKIKIFLCISNGVILTKDNLIKGNWKDSPKCCFVIVTKFDSQLPNMWDTELGGVNPGTIYNRQSSRLSWHDDKQRKDI